MIEATKGQGDYQLVLAGAPAIEADYYSRFIEGTPVRLVQNDTYPLLAHAYAALVTSGTATLETALFSVPQVVCYETPLPRLIGYLRKKVLHVKYISLVNLIVDRELVRELVADSFTIENIRQELSALLTKKARETMLAGYDEVRQRLGTEQAPTNAAKMMVTLLNS